MVDVAIECRDALEDYCDQIPELADLKLKPTDWQELKDLRSVLKPFWEYIEFVSKESLTL